MILQKLEQNIFVFTKGFRYRYTIKKTLKLRVRLVFIRRLFGDPYMLLQVLLLCVELSYLHPIVSSSVLKKMFN